MIVFRVFLVRSGHGQLVVKKRFEKIQWTSQNKEILLMSTIIINKVSCCPTSKANVSSTQAKMR